MEFLIYSVAMAAVLGVTLLVLHIEITEYKQRKLARWIAEEKPARMKRRLRANDVIRQSNRN